MRLILLSDAFYNAHVGHNEILQKRTRPYACLSVRIGNVLFAIPFRHHIAHRNAFFTYDCCGLDYTKTVVIENPSQIAAVTPTIEQVEFDALKGKDIIISNGLRRYIKLYKKAVEHRNNPYYANIIAFSSLQYFEAYIKHIH